jgi:glycosyltransferase involved in cell wall biosynthesis
LSTSSYETPLNFPSHALKHVEGKKVVFCIPTLTKPHQATLDSLAASIPLIEAAGWDEGTVYQIGCPYVSAARSLMLRKALDAKADVIVFIDHDLSWDPQDLLTLIETKGEVIAGTYRFKGEPEEYMGALLPDIEARPQVRADGCVKAHSVPAGFLKITRAAVNKFIAEFPELCYGDKCSPGIDIFNHGAWNGIWYGEDYAFSRRWLEKCGDIWIVPNLNLNHHLGDKKFAGNFHEFLLRQPMGSKSANPVPPKLALAA